MAICKWPERERPRERLLAKGASALSDAELLAIFLRTGVKGKSAVDLARELITEYKGLRPLLQANKEEFCKNKGLGSAKFAQLQATLEIGRRCLEEKMERQCALTNPDSAKRFLSRQLRDQPNEVFACLFLDNHHRIIKYEELFCGTINATQVHPRTVVKRGLYHNSAALIAAHNHPSGIAEPSGPDIRITEHLRQALELVDIRLLDHLIIGDGCTVSMKERGLI